MDSDSLEQGLHGSPDGINNHHCNRLDGKSYLGLEMPFAPQKSQQRTKKWVDMKRCRGSSIQDLTGRTWDLVKGSRYSWTAQFGTEGMG